MKTVQEEGGGWKRETGRIEKIKQLRHCGAGGKEMRMPRTNELAEL